MNLTFSRIVLHCVLLLAIPFYAEAQTKPLIIAHRGASGYAPENTIASIDKALEIGVDVIEIDIHLTKDGEVIVMHDEKLDRTTDKSGLIKDYNWDDVKSADAGSWFGEKFAGEKIPTLHDVITRISGRALLLIEIKKGGSYYPGIERKALDIIRTNHAESWCMIQSFADAAVNNFLALNSGLKVYKLVVGNIPVLPFYHDGRMRWGSILKYRQVTGVNPYRSFAKKRIVTKLHERGQQIFVWTVNDEKDMKKLIALGVDGIITNYPDRLKKVMGECELKIRN